MATVRSIERSLDLRSQVEFPFRPEDEAFKVDVCLTALSPSPHLVNPATPRRL